MLNSWFYSYIYIAYSNVMSASINRYISARQHIQKQLLKYEKILSNSELTKYHIKAFQFSVIDEFILDFFFCTR